MTKASERPRRWVHWLPAIAMVVLIFVLSSQSGLRVSDDVEVDRPFRIAGHLLAFGTLAALLVVALSQGRQPRVQDLVLAFGLTVAYGFLDEWHQSFVPDRSGRLDDVVTDALGAIVGLALASMVLSRLARRQARRQSAG